MKPDDDLSSGNLSLEFVNALDFSDDQACSSQQRYERLVAWSRESRLLTRAVAGELIRESKRHPRRAGAVVCRAASLRTSLRNIFRTLIDGQRPTRNDLATLNDELCGAMACARVVPAAEGFTWAFGNDDSAMDQMLFPIARSAAEVLTSDYCARVRACSAETCDWLFLDTTKNASRRWCDMKVCGNRAKVRAHRERQSKC